MNPLRLAQADAPMGAVQHSVNGYEGRRKGLDAFFGEQTYQLQRIIDTLRST